jgi:transporter family-2 protein
MMLLLSVFPILMGAGLGMQIAVSSKLQKFTSSPYLSSLTSFIVGTLFLGLLTLLSQASLAIPVTTLTSQPWWIWLGGFLGVFYLTSTILLFPRLGGVQTAVLPILGQISMGILIDQFGFFESPTVTLTVTRGVGLGLVLIGVLVTIEVFSKRKSGKDSDQHQPTHLPWQVLGVVAGMCSAISIAVNGHLGVVLGSSVQAATVAFFIGTLLLLGVVLLTKTPFQNIKIALQSGKKYWWIWTGGLLGGLYVFGSAFLVPKIGTGQVVVLALFGQLVFSAIIDHWGLFESKPLPIHRQKIIGLLLLFLGVVVINFL